MKTDNDGMEHRVLWRDLLIGEISKSSSLRGGWLLCNSSFSRCRDVVLLPWCVIFWHTWERRGREYYEKITGGCLRVTGSFSQKAAIVVCCCWVQHSSWCSWRRLLLDGYTHTKKIDLRYWIVNWLIEYNGLLCFNLRF